MTKDLVMECGEDSCFRLADGRAIKNLNELSKSLDTMDENLFRHHVNDERNDFSNWIRDVIKDEKLAEDLLIVRDKNIAQVVVLKRIIELVKEITR